MPKKKPAGQLPIAGTERETIKEVSEKMKELHDVQSQRIKLTVDEGVLRENLQELMKKHKLKEYVDDSFDKPLIAKEKRSITETVSVTLFKVSKPKED